MKILEFSSRTAAGVLAVVVLSSLSPAQDPDSVISRTMTLVEKHKVEIDQIRAEAQPQAERLDRAWAEVERILADTDLPESERLARAAKAKDEVIEAIDEILAGESAVKRSFIEQLDALRSAWNESRTHSPGGGADEASRQALEHRKEYAAWLAQAGETPPDWRELFAKAFEILSLEEAGTEELTAEQRRIWAETVKALTQLRREFYLAYAEDARGYASLRMLRSSTLLQKRMLLSSKDLLDLRAASASALGITKGILERQQNGAGAIEAVRKVLQKLRGHSSPPAPDAAETRRSMAEYARRFAERQSGHEE